MKYKKRILTFVLLISLIINLIPLNVKADGIGSGFNARSGVDIDLPIGGIYNSDCYVYNPTVGGSLPEGIKFYFKYADGKAYHLNFDNVCTQVLNEKIGLTMSTTVLSGWLSAVLNYAVNFGQNISAPAWVIPCPLKPVCIYDGDNDKYVLRGFALTNDLDGCVITTPSDNPNVNIPSDFTNYLKDFTDYYIENEGLDTPDFINIGTVTENIAKNYVSSNTSSYANTLALIENPPYDYMFCYSCSTSTSDCGKFWTSTYYANYNRYYALSDYSDCIFTTYFSSSQTNYVNFLEFCSNFSLTRDKNTVSVQELINYSSSVSLVGYIFKNGQKIDPPYYDVVSGSSTSSSNQAVNFYHSQRKIIPFSNTGFITIYKDISIPNAISLNTYSPSFFTSNTYMNYSSSNNNSVSTNVTTISNSQSTNTNIYNQSKTTTNQNITTNNYQVDNSVNDNSVTNIINNYYGSSGGDDNGGGDDDDNNGIWERFLNAIADFFSKIGDIIVAILTGIVEIFGKVLEGIASIITDFTGITDFFTQVFSFLPSDLVAVMSLALTTALLISLIRMFRK